MKKGRAWMLAAVLLFGLVISGTAYASGESGETSETETLGGDGTSAPEEQAGDAEEQTEDAQKETEDTKEQTGDPERALGAAVEKGRYAGDEVIADGVYIDEIDVGGMTPEEALRTVLSYVEEAKKKTLTVTLEGAEEVEPITTTASELGLHTNEPSEIIMEALALGKDGNLITRYKAEKDLKTSNQVFELGMAIDQEQVSRFVTERTEGLSVEPVDAELTRTGDGFSVSESRTGIKVDVPATIEEVKKAFQDWNREDVTLAAVAEITQPRYTTAVLSQIQDPLGEFSTKTSDRSGGKLQNVQRGVDLTNGILIMPGESWSMHDALAPFTAENGYTVQIAYQGNSYVQEYGGGICQLATTLYNAALLSEVNISKRSNHSMVVKYTLEGLDATINDGGSKDLELTNDFDFPIYIEARHNGGGKVTYTIWGKETRPENRTLKFTHNILSEEYLPDEVTVDPGMAPGSQDVKQATSYPKMTVEAYKEIYVDGVLQERIKLHTDKYLASARKVVKGPDLPVDPSTGLPVGADPNGGQQADPGVGQPEAPDGGQTQAPPAAEAPTQAPPAAEVPTQAPPTEAPSQPELSVPAPED